MCFGAINACQDLGNVEEGIATIDKYKSPDEILLEFEMLPQSYSSGRRPALHYITSIPMDQSPLVAVTQRTSGPHFKSSNSSRETALYPMLSAHVHHPLIACEMEGLR
jgi:hypothetical protein